MNDPLCLGVYINETGPTQDNEWFQGLYAKGQLISKANSQAVNSSKKRMNEFVFSSMRHVFFCFSEEIEDSKK